MRGHEPLIDARRNGVKPTGTVCIDLDFWVPEWADWPLNYPGSPRIGVDPEDAIARLDLRCLVGLQVDISGTDAARVREMFGAVQDHAAARVIATVSKRRGDTFDTVEIMDSAAILTWSKSFAELSA